MDQRAARPDEIRTGHAIIVRSERAFRPLRGHSDGYFERPNGERSFFAFMIYLNDDFEGGGTSFRDDGFRRSEFGQFMVTPKKGMGLMFHHPTVHRGGPKIRGPHRRDV